jgi:hypothetical protein
MPSPLYEMQARDFRIALRDAGTSLVFGGRTIPCLFAATDDDFQLAPDGGGEFPIYNLVATALRLEFLDGILPKKGELITAEGTHYQVGRTNARPGSPLVKIYCANLDA